MFQQGEYKHKGCDTQPGVGWGGKEEQFMWEQKRNEKNRKTQNFPVKNNKIYSLSYCFGWSSVFFGSIETSKISVSVQKRNNRNKRFVSDSAETSFGSSFGCFESKLVSKDTLPASKGGHRHLQIGRSSTVDTDLISDIQSKGVKDHTFWKIRRQ